MTNPTSNFGWQMPTPTDLVTSLPADFEVFGQAVDTSMADLKGGTTGQILSKATNTDMDFVWIANDQGDITGITATSPLTGGGTSGAITVGIQASSTTQSGAVQLSDSTSTTSSVLAATPTAVKSAYDLANAAIAKSTVTTAGDIIYRNATVPTRLGIGTAGQVLTVNSGATAPEWTTVSGGPNFATATGTTEAAESTSSTTFTSLATETQCTVTTGTKALVIISATSENNSQLYTTTYASYAVSGATTISAGTPGVGRQLSIRASQTSVFGVNAAQVYWVTGLTAGSNTFTMKFAVGAGGNSGRWYARSITVVNMGS